MPNNLSRKIAEAIFAKWPDIDVESEIGPKALADLIERAGVGALEQDLADGLAEIKRLRDESLARFVEAKQQRESADGWRRERDALAKRLAAVEALCQQARDEGYPTLSIPEVVAILSSDEGSR